MRYLLSVLSFFLVPLLPEKFRDMWPWELPMSMDSLAHISAYMHTVISIVSWMVGLVLYQEKAAEMVTAALADERGSGEVGRLTWYGMVTFWSFFASPQGILLTLYVLDSAARIIHAATAGGPMGSLFFSVPLYFVGKLVDATTEAKRTAVYGNADAPDRISHLAEGLVLRSNRPHADWHGDLTYEFEGAFYQMGNVNEGTEGARICYEYYFKPWPERVIVRSVVHLGTEAAPGAGGQAGTGERGE